ncbi:MAG: radical SAM family heme chaperone HemW [Myxococcota bacterium]|nr:radical SAM family heme chaperone HemW [Myxococcota bacterium]
MGPDCFGVYVHFPYCRQRCPYCDFAVSVQPSVPHERYRDQVLAELAARAPLYAGRALVSIYFGGGTPSLWRPDCIAAVRRAVLATFPPRPGIEPEVTVEADPADLSDEVLLGLRAAGVNRLSLGVQSLTDRHLLRLGRQHDAAQARSAVARARAAGFANLSLDLMIGLPGQRWRELEEDLEGFLSLAPEHLSVYQLTVEPGTALAAAVRAGKVRMPGDARQAEAYQRAKLRLQEAGYQHYEISSYARGGGQDLRAVHNRLYWTLGEYLGLGVSAHSFRRLPDGGGERFANPRSTRQYLARAFVPALEPADDASLAYHERLEPEALARQGLWLGLRLLEGLSLDGFRQQHGYDPLLRHGDEIGRLLARGLLERSGDVLRLTSRGVLLADEVGVALV